MRKRESRQRAVSLKKMRPWKPSDNEYLGVLLLLPFLFFFLKKKLLYIHQDTNYNARIWQRNTLAPPVAASDHH